MSIKNFVGISAEIKNNVVTSIVTSSGHRVEDEGGISTLDVITFLHSLSYKHKQTIYVCYNFQITNEHIFSSLSKSIKSELLQSYDVRNSMDELSKLKADFQAKWHDKRLELSDEETVYLYNELTSVSNQLAVKGFITLGEYRIELSQGKQLNIKKDKKTFVLYDIHGFFREPLRQSITKYLHIEPHTINELASLKGHLNFEAEYIAKLANYVYLSFMASGIKLNSFHGAGAITSAVLNQTKAKDEYKSYKKAKYSSDVIHKAVNNSFYGGRMEQQRLGKVENVNVYDINSAYAAGALLLPRMLNRPVYTRTYNTLPFSCWHVEYDLPRRNHFGLLPYRDIGTQIPVYKRRGRGYYWQPEVEFLLKHYLEHIKIGDGFYVPDVRANFTKAIADLYELRKELKANSNPLEKIIKLALAIFYGKFCQTIGKKKHYNLYYAGFLTSYTRAKLLEATIGFEKETICFLTDAIHTTARLDLPISDKLGEWRHKGFDIGYYFGAGIYDLHGKDVNGKVVRKQAKRGYTELDFDAALETLKTSGKYTAIKEFFIGHNLHVFDDIEFADYLQPYKKVFNINPLALSESKTRLFEAFNVDLSKTSVSSSMIDTNSGLMSSDYQAYIPNDIVMKFDAVSVGKV